MAEFKFIAILEQGKTDDPDVIRYDFTRTIEAEAKEEAIKEIKKEYIENTGTDDILRFYDGKDMGDYILYTYNGLYLSPEDDKGFLLPTDKRIRFTDFIEPIIPEKYPQDLAHIIDELAEMPEIIVEVIGKWIWVTGKVFAYHNSHKLRGLDFQYSHSKSAFYRPNIKRKVRHNKYGDMDELREAWDVEAPIQN